MAEISSIARGKVAALAADRGAEQGDVLLRERDGQAEKGRRY